MSILVKLSLIKVRRMVSFLVQLICRERLLHEILKLVFGSPGLLKMCNMLVTCVWYHVIEAALIEKHRIFGRPVALRIHHLTHQVMI